MTDPVYEICEAVRTDYRQTLLWQFRAGFRIMRKSPALELSIPGLHGACQKFAVETRLFFSLAAKGRVTSFLGFESALEPFCDSVAKFPRRNLICDSFATTQTLNPAGVPLIHVTEAEPECQ